MKKVPETPETPDIPEDPGPGILYNITPTTDENGALGFEASRPDGKEIQNSEAFDVLSQIHDAYISDLENIAKDEENPE